MDVRQLAEWSSSVLGILGLTVILLGTALAVVAGLVRAARRRNATEAYRRIRLDVGRSILLGLELLVAGDIIRTVAIQPSLASVASLGLIVLIRTFLSISIEVDLEGRWPWKAHEAGGTRNGA